jgi:hypothetical protein
MKNLFITVVTFSVLFLIGCQENSITEPVTVEPTNKVEQDNNGTHRDIIRLEGLLVDPSVPFNSYLTISGQIEYSHTIVGAPSPISEVFIRFNVEANLQDTAPFTDPIMTISSQTEDNIYVPEFGYMFEKSFPIQDRIDGMVLVCQFLVTTESVSLSSMWLALPKATAIN